MVRISSPIRHLEDARFYVGDLAVVVLVQLTDSTRLKVDLDQHDLIIVAHDLALEAGALLSHHSRSLPKRNSLLACIRS